MKVIIILFLYVAPFSSFAQQILGTSFQSVRDDCMKYNNIVSAMYYKETPMMLIMSRTKETYDYTKSFMFENEKCVSETYFYPPDHFEKKYNTLTVLYGEPTKNLDVYSFIEEGLQITLTVVYNQMFKKELLQINYSYITDLNIIASLNTKAQSPYVHMIKLK